MCEICRFPAYIVKTGKLQTYGLRGLLVGPLNGLQIGFNNEIIFTAVMYPIYQ